MNLYSQIERRPYLVAMAGCIGIVAIDALRLMLSIRDMRLLIDAVSAVAQVVVVLSVSEFFYQMLVQKKSESYARVISVSAFALAVAFLVVLRHAAVLALF